MPRILGLESSCDETAAAVLADGRRVLSNVISSQHELHERYRGVVPEIASRAHVERLWPVVEQAVTQAGMSLREVEAIAVGNRPGLIGSLVVGVSAAKALAWALQKPLLGIDHVQAHLYAPHLAPGLPGAGCGVTEQGADRRQAGGYMNNYPALGLVVSGGHTTLYRVDSPTQLHRLGGTIDDAVGEAYDKAAVILDAGYPGGPAVDRLAQRGDPQGPGAVDFPRSMLGKDSLDFSFSGLKTALLYAVRGHPVGRGEYATFERSIDDLTDTHRANLAAAFQAAAMDAILKKLQRGIDHMTASGTPPKALLLGGGVTANSELRKRVESLPIPALLPALPYCLDNAAMLAGLAHHRLLAGEADGLDLPAIATTAA